MRLIHLVGGVFLFALFLVTFFLIPTSRANDDGCAEILLNGDMENYTNWIIYQGGYSGNQFISPVRSALLGIIDSENAYAYSSMKQTIDVPTGNHLVLSWHMYPKSAPFDSEDLQWVSILQGEQPYSQLRRVWSDVRDDTAWMTCSYDISEFLDQDIILYLAVRNDGDGGKTAMYVDDVSLKVCQSPSFTLDGCLPSTPTPTPTQTMTPISTSTPHTTYLPLMTRF